MRLAIRDTSTTMPLPIPRTRLTLVVLLAIVLVARPAREARRPGPSDSRDRSRAGGRPGGTSVTRSSGTSASRARPTAAPGANGWPSPARGVPQVYFSHAVGQPRVIAELTPSVWIKSDRPGLQLLARVVLPRTEDPRSGQPVSTLVAGTSYTQVGRWQQLHIRGIPNLLARQVRVLRLQLGPGVDAPGGLRRPGALERLRWAGHDERLDRRLGDCRLRRVPARRAAPGRRQPATGEPPGGRLQRRRPDGTAGSRRGGSSCRVRCSRWTATRCCPGRSSTRASRSRG